jgi:LemA protein
MQSAKSLQEKANADGIAASAIKTIFAVAENYPDLKANQNFLALQKRISELENYIADRREFYNDSVTLFNNRVEQFPSNILSVIFGYKEKELFRAEEKKHSKL